MKNKLLLFSVMAIAIAIALIVGNAIKSNDRDVMLSFENVEALSQGEIIYVQYCRCHNDGVCHDGSAISFRPACAVLPYDGTPGGYSECSGANSNCPN